MWSTSSSGPRVDFAICGGIAVTIHGAPRFTRDIDLLIRAEDESRAVGAVASPSFEDVWSTRVLVEWEGRRVPVVSVGGLIRMKRVAGRPQDLVDIENLSALTALPEE